MIMQMRIASYFGKVASRNLKSATAGEVYAAATLGGARSARARRHRPAGPRRQGGYRDLRPHRGGNSLRIGPVRDPIKSLVECGIGDDVDTVIVDGVVRVEAGRVPGVDMAALRAQAQDAGERVWGRWAEWDPLGRSADDMCPLAFPRMN